ELSALGRGIERGGAAPTPHRVEVAEHDDVVVLAGSAGSGANTRERLPRLFSERERARIRAALQVHADDLEVEPTREPEVSPEARAKLVPAGRPARVQLSVHFKAVRACPRRVPHDGDVLRRRRVAFVDS